VLRVAIVGG